MTIVKRLIRKIRSFYWSKKLRTNLIAHGPFTICHPENVKIGDNCSINHNVFILGFSSVTIGSNVTLSYGVSIFDSGLHLNKSDRTHIRSFVKIENNVWIGAGAIILPGVIIGKGSVIGAGAVVTKSVEPNSVVAGNPAKSIKDG